MSTRAAYLAAPVFCIFHLPSISPSQDFSNWCALCEESPLLYLTVLSCIQYSVVHVSVVNVYVCSHSLRNVYMYVLICWEMRKKNVERIKWVNIWLWVWMAWVSHMLSSRPEFSPLCNHQTQAVLTSCVRASHSKRLSKRAAWCLLKPSYLRTGLRDWKF